MHIASRSSPEYSSPRRGRGIAQTVEWRWEMVNADDDGHGARLDVWLDVACLFRTRSEAQKACRAGKVTANGQSAKQNRRLKVGDEVELSRPFGRKQRVKVLA